MSNLLLITTYAQTKSYEEYYLQFRLLRTGLDRSRYLLVKEAKIIAMTCTHAALKRRELVDLSKFNFYKVSIQ